MLRATLVAAVFLGASFMAAPALAGVEDQPRLIPAEWVWNQGQRMKFLSPDLG